MEEDTDRVPDMGDEGAIVLFLWWFDPGSTVGFGFQNGRDMLIPGFRVFDCDMQH